MEERVLSDTEKREIAELAADIAYQRFYSAVGESFVKKAIWVLGAGAIAVFVYLNSNLPKG